MRLQNRVDDRPAPAIYMRRAAFLRDPDGNRLEAV
jgi:catechol 2,3-dioxygenase-like lactoylglutathione lyase family enzyme